MKLKLTNINKSYGKQQVLKDINFEFGNSNIVGLIGKNGVGKTTFMKILNENITKFSGTYNRDNQAKIGYLIENPKLYLNQSGLYNLKLFKDVLGTNVDESYLEQLIDSFGMRPYIHKKVGKYSMGMKQKLSIAVALINKPKFLILDEPTNGMDPDGSIDILKTIEKISNDLNTKVLISSHKLEDIELICDRTLFMKDGKIVEDYDMTNQSKRVTRFIFDEKEYNNALEILTMKYKVVTSNKNESIIAVDEIGNYQAVLKDLTTKEIYPKFIENNKVTLRDQYFNINKGVE